MSTAAHVFVGVIFTILGISFVATTAALYYEFGYTNPHPDIDWVALVTFYSHLFIFFPVFGLLALAAFYIPCVAFTDMYLNHVPMGPLRFGFWFVTLLVVSVYGAQMLGGGNLRSIWEVKPDILVMDQGEALTQCPASGPCLRVPVLKALADVRARSQKRTGMGALVRDCQKDDLLQTPAEASVKKHCFVVGSHTVADTCCKAQRQFGAAIDRMYTPLENRSLTVKVHEATLPGKLFFLFVVLVVGALLALRRRGLAQHYPDWLPKIERGVLVGAFAMLFLPVMNLAFLQSSSLLYGNEFESLYRNISLPSTALFGVWALTLLFFFFRDTDKEVETVGRIAGVVGSFFAVSNYDIVINYFTRFAGSGATDFTLGLLGILAVGALVAIVIQPKGRRVRADSNP